MKSARTARNGTRVFISHAPSEEKWAKELAAGLLAAGVRVWMAELELYPGDNWALETSKALEKSNFMIVLVSPAAMKSPWVRSEIEFALGAPQYAFRLLAVVVKPSRDIPWILKKLNLVRLYKGPEEAARRIVQELRGVAKATG